MKTKALHIILIVFAAMVPASCTISKYVGPDQHVLHHVQLDVQMADGSKATPEVGDVMKNAKNYYLQRPNTKLLGMKGVPFSKWLYCFMTDTSSNIWNNYMHRIGQAPVIYDDNRARQTASQLERLLESNGCFGSTVTFDTAKLHRRNITIAYHVSATPRYTIDEVVYHVDNQAVSRLLDRTASEAIIKAGLPYSQSDIAAERTRIVNTMREAGYYMATPEHISFLVDTTYDSQRLSIDVYVAAADLGVHHINNIYIYPNSNAGLQTGETTFDTLIYTYPGVRRRIDYNFVYDRPMTIRPETICRSLMILPGMTYRPRYINNTYNSLLGLRNFRYINIEFSPSPSSTDSLPLVDAHVRLINSTQQRLSLSLELTNASPLGAQDSGNFFSNGNLGIETALEYQHKNLFGGAELLRVKGSLLFELPKLSLRNQQEGFYNTFSAFEAGLDLSLDMPIFLLPFSDRIIFQRTKPHTLFSLGGSYQYRYYFERILANTSFGYTWSHYFRRNTEPQNQPTAKHQLLPVEMTFVRMLSIDEAFMSRLRQVSDLRLKYQYSSHFILNARYDYTYTNQRYGQRRHFTALRLTLESAGNTLDGLCTAIGTPTDSAGIRQLLGVPFSQYLRIGTELTRYRYVGTKSTLVAHLLLGAGIPYGNSLSMPYEKSFFGGGPTSMRAWQLRHLGPGSYNQEGEILERVGDLQLVLNLEARFPIARIFEGAIFTDMGNVWLLNTSNQYAGGEIKWNSIPSEIAVGIGLGLRINITIATLRLDAAIPLYDPGFATTLRWRPPHWHINQTVLNFGINYPF